MRVSRLFSNVGITKDTVRSLNNTQKNVREKRWCTALHSAGYFRGVSFLETSTLSSEHSRLHVDFQKLTRLLGFEHRQSYIPSSKRKKGPGSLCERVKITPSSVFDFPHSFVRRRKRLKTLRAVSFSDNGLFIRSHARLGLPPDFPLFPSSGIDFEHEFANTVRGPAIEGETLLVKKYIKKLRCPVSE